MKTKIKFYAAWKRNAKTGEAVGIAVFRKRKTDALAAIGKPLFSERNGYVGRFAVQIEMEFVATAAWKKAPFYDIIEYIVWASKPGIECKWRQFDKKYRVLKIDLGSPDRPLLQFWRDEILQGRLNRNLNLFTETLKLERIRDDYNGPLCKNDKDKF